ncbi:thioredoxin domain-containing protein [Candidatus Uhrbacteria bacterium]|nr:thioredoxin domain-containing protein [Candidatus Uhrbacteria bacterium]
MSHRWLTFLTIGVLSIIVFIFFGLRLRPIEIPKIESVSEAGSQAQPTITFVNPWKGAEDAKVTMVVFSDFQCDACATLATSLDVALKTYPDDVRLVWKNLPNESLHPLATPAAIAAHCAADQNTFWEFHDELFAKQAYLSESLFTQIASSIGLNVDKFQSCYDKRDTLPIVTKDYEEGLALGLTSTPSLYVGDQLLIGAIDVQELLSVIEEQLSLP